MNGATYTKQFCKEDRKHGLYDSVNHSGENTNNYPRPFGGVQLPQATSTHFRQILEWENEIPQWLAKRRTKWKARFQAKRSRAILSISACLHFVSWQLRAHKKGDVVFNLPPLLLFPPRWIWCALVCRRWKLCATAAVWLHGCVVASVLPQMQLCLWMASAKKWGFFLQMKPIWIKIVQRIPLWMC